MTYDWNDPADRERYVAQEMAEINNWLDNPCEAPGCGKLQCHEHVGIERDPGYVAWLKEKGWPTS